MTHVPPRLGGCIDANNYAGTVTPGVGYFNSMQDDLNLCFNYIPSRDWQSVMKAGRKRKDLLCLLKQRLAFQRKAVDRLGRRSFGINKAGNIQLRKPKKILVSNNRQIQAHEQMDVDQDGADEQKQEETENQNDDGTQNQEEADDDGQLHGIQTDDLKVSA